MRYDYDSNWKGFLKAAGNTVNFVQLSDPDVQGSEGQRRPVQGDACQPGDLRLFRRPPSGIMVITL